MSKFSLVATENQYLTDSDKRNFAKQRPGLWPSEMSVEYIDRDGLPAIKGKCRRAVFYRIHKYPVDGRPDPAQEMKFQLGRSIEEAAIERWKSMGIYVSNTVKFFIKDLYISGEIDAIIKNPETGNLIIIEEKSYYGHYANKEICGGKKPPLAGKPKWEHVLQTTIYHEEYKDTIPEARIHYTERGDGHRVEFEIGSDDGKPYWQQIDGPYWNHFVSDKVYAPFTIQDIHNTCKTLVKMLNNKELPKRDYSWAWTDAEVEKYWIEGEVSKTDYEKWKKGGFTLSNWQCDYCGFKSQCRNDSTGE